MLVYLYLGNHQSRVFFSRLCQESHDPTAGRREGGGKEKEKEGGRKERGGKGERKEKKLLGGWLLF